MYCRVKHTFPPQTLDSNKIDSEQGFVHEEEILTDCVKARLRGEETNSVFQSITKVTYC